MTYQLPAGASEALRDFLLQCFNREAALRANAPTRLGHAWLQRAISLSPPRLLDSQRHLLVVSSPQFQ